MTINSGHWIRFEVDLDSTNDNYIVRHKLSCTTSLDGMLPARCYMIEITSQMGRESKTISIQDTATCALELALNQEPYRGSILTAIIQQTPLTNKEVYTARHTPGVPLKGLCRLDPVLTDLEAWCYLASNIDVVEACGASPSVARDHYRDHGRYEARSFSFDPLLYLASNPDLEFFGEDEIAACKHYIEYGHVERRLISFHPSSYLKRNPDVHTSLGGDERAASLHYLRHGRNEGRALR